jgi:hypothetical protein
MGFTDENFRASRFIRLNVISDLRRRGLVDEDLVFTSLARQRGLTRPGLEVGR